MPEWFSQTVAYAEEHKDRFGILLVANINGRTTPLDDYETDSIITEFLTEEELDEFVLGFGQAGIYCEALLDEEGFIGWFQRSSKFERPSVLVYNLAQNGIGPGRLSLVPGLCRLRGLPLFDSDGYVVALTQHKFHCASLISHYGLPSVESWWFTEKGWLTCSPPLGLKVIAKPTYDSASIGIHSDSVFIMGPDSEEFLCEKVARYHQPFTVQKFVAGYEVEVPVWGGDEPRVAMAVGIASGKQRNLQEAVLTYEEIFNDQYVFYDFSDEDKFLADQIMDLARKTYHILGMRGAGRIDFRVGSDQVPRIMEVACKPHLTKHSSFAHVVHQLGYAHKDMLKYFAGEAAHRHNL